MYIVYPRDCALPDSAHGTDDRSNGPQLVNARQYLNVLIVDQLAPRLELRVGLEETAEVVTITRGNLKTIACPGHDLMSSVAPGRTSSGAEGASAMMRTAPRPFGTPSTRLHAGRILLTLVTLAGLVFGAWIWAFRKGADGSKVVTESSTPAGWTAAQMHYDKPEVKAEAPAPKPIDTTAAELAKLRAMMLAMQAGVGGT